MKTNWNFDVQITKEESGNFVSAVTPDSGSAYLIPAGDLGEIAAMLSKYMMDHVTDSLLSEVQSDE